VAECGSSLRVPAETRSPGSRVPGYPGGTRPGGTRSSGTRSGGPPPGGAPHGGTPARPGPTARGKGGGCMRRARGSGSARGSGASRVPRVTVVGSLNTDISLAVPHLPGPGETVLSAAGAAIGGGGKGANQAVAAARLGAAVRMVGCCGDDEFGTGLRAGLAAEGVDASGV